MGPAPPKSRSDVKPPLEPELRLSPPPLSAAAFLVALGLLGSARAVHIADNGDGTFTNPVMPNAHWSDPAVLRHGIDYYVVTSSIETSPSLQILHSTDLVNYDVIGSVSRHWYGETVDGVPLSKKQCWSPRLSFVAGRFRVMWHQSGHFMVAEAEAAQGPWALIHHNLTGMAQPSPQWAATAYTDPHSGKSFVYAFNWIRETDAAALNWIGPQHVVADMHAIGVGLMENPSLMRRGEYYYWHESVNGTVTWGLAPDPNAGPASTNKGALAVWRSKSITGPWEGPRDLLTSNVHAACVNTGTVVLGPDNITWYYLYDAIEPGRWNLQRQMYVDRIAWADDGWPVPRTPGRRNRIPAGGVSPPVAARWRPELSDEFDGSTLEGVTAGVLGRKWLFKQENSSLWSVKRGALALEMGCSPGIESAYPANLLLQRPTSAYYRIETALHWPKKNPQLAKKVPAATVAVPNTGIGGGGGDGGTSCDGPGSTAGLIARELNTGAGVAIGLVCNSTTGLLEIAAWQDTLNLLHAIPFPASTVLDGDAGAPGFHTIRLRIDVELVLAQVWFSVGGGAWSAMPPFETGSRGSEMTFEYVSTPMAWQAVGPDPAAWDRVYTRQPSDAFTTLHPGLFAGGGPDGGAAARENLALFDYFRWTDNEVYPVDEV